MIEPNDTMKMTIGKEAILQRTFNIKNLATMHCEHDWKVSATIDLQLSKRVTPSTVDNLSLLFDLQAYLKLLSTECI